MICFSYFFWFDELELQAPAGPADKVGVRRVVEQGDEELPKLQGAPPRVPRPAGRAPSPGPRYAAPSGREALGHPVGAPAGQSRRPRHRDRRRGRRRRHLVRGLTRGRSGGGVIGRAVTRRTGGRFREVIGSGVEAVLLSAVAGRRVTKIGDLMRIVAAV